MANEKPNLRTRMTGAKEKTYQRLAAILDQQFDRIDEYEWAVLEQLDDGTEKFTKLKLTAVRGEFDLDEALDNYAFKMREKAEKTAKTDAAKN